MKIIQYLQETKGELKHVVWPTKRQAAVFTVLVILVSIATAYYLGLFDFLFSRALEAVLQ